MVQLGYGCNQRRIEATITDATSSIAVEIAGDKERTKTILTAANIPVPEGSVVNTVDKLKEMLEAVNYPVVLKPLNSNHGKGTTIDIHN
ncbi:MAG: hypothetical protein ACTHMD_07730, partial [Flavisolibacter sp.]